jgi:type 2 lantibiotic biosynthesis protein LanM
MTAEADLRRIAAEAAPLQDRLRGLVTPDPGPESARRAEARLGQWRRKAAGGDAELFARRLSWLGLTPERALALLGDVRLEGDLPAWTGVLARALDAAPAAGAPRARRHPFDSVLLPFLAAGRAALAPACQARLTAGALDDLEDDLLRELSLVAAPTLYLEFLEHRARQGSYDTFVAGLLGGGLPPFFSRYAALARLLSITADLWARNVSRLAGALEADLPEIARVFGNGAPPGRVAAVRPSLSDRHDGGRTVSILEFESGLRLVHKPRDLGIETAWFSLLGFLNERGGDFRLLRVLDRGSHGWAEPADPAPCGDLREGERFYFRSGALLAVLYLLEASDCFHENVVACGGHPVLIDMETLMHHVLRRSRDLTPAEELADGILFNSVFRAGLLPSWESGPEGGCVDISGLGATVGQVTPFLKRRWSHANTDAMVLEHVPIRIETGDHLPHVDGAALRVADHAEPVVAGFRAMYDLLLRHREELAAPGGPLDDLGSREIRLVFHATRIYGLLLKRLYSPRHLRAGVDRSIEMDLVSRFYLESREKARFLPILEAEIEAMERLDIPRFSVRADSLSLALPTGRTLPEAFEESAVERVRRRLASLDAADRELQTELIRASLRMSVVSLGHEAGPAGDARPAAPAGGPPLSRTELAAEAAAIAALIESRAISSSDRSVTWLAPQLLPGTSRQHLSPLRMDLYNGLAGIALFFSALERVEGWGRHTALAALAPLRRQVAAMDARRLTREGYTLGAATGAGSFVYVLCRCASLLGEPALLEDAAAVAALVTPEWIAADDLFDVMSGSAGAILGLLALHEATGEAGALAQAVLCGEHLLESREPAGNGGASWRSAKGTFLTGLSHGAAGVALALLRLGRASGDPRFRRAAEEAVAFESSVFDDAEGNWPDFRKAGGARPAFMNAWCHGASGIGLARLSGLPLLDSPAIRRDIGAAVSAVVRGGLGEKDGLCCGNLGRVDLLLAAAALGDGGDLDGEAVRCAAQVVERARRSGGYRFSGVPGRDFFDPSFFQGLSGVGYQLLRVAHPAELPSVLTWE